MMKVVFADPGATRAQKDKIEKTEAFYRLEVEIGKNPESTTEGYSASQRESVR